MKKEEGKPVRKIWVDTKKGKAFIKSEIPNSVTYALNEKTGKTERIFKEESDEYEKSGFFGFGFGYEERIKKIIKEKDPVQFKRMYPNEK